MELIIIRYEIKTVGLAAGPAWSQLQPETSERSWEN